jgi:hypothetical protein
LQEAIMSDKNAFEVGVAISALLDAEISDEHLAQLQARLKDDPAAREMYVEECQVHFLLQEYFSGLRKQVDSTPVISALHLPTNLGSTPDVHV